VIKIRQYAFLVRRVLRTSILTKSIKYKRIVWHIAVMAATATTTESTTISDTLDKLSKEEILKLADFIIDNYVQDGNNLSLDNDLNLEQNKRLSQKDIIKYIQDKKAQQDNSTLNISKAIKDDPGFAKNEASYDNFVKNHLNDPEYKDRFVAFVNGKLQGVDDKESTLAKKVYDKCGHVDMYIGKVSTQKIILDMACRV
jgi:hypothetical protein